MSTAIASPRRTCLSFAHRQHGVVARFQLIEAGVSAAAIDHGLRSRFLFRVLRGVYAVGRPELSEKGLWMACVLAAGPGSALAGRTAAVAWGFQNRPSSPIHVARPGNEGRKELLSLKARGHRSRAMLRTSRCRWLSGEDVTRLDGIPILHLEPLLLQLAALMGNQAFQYAFWEADRKRGLDDQRLDRCLALSHGRKGGGAFRESVDCRLPHIHEALSLLEVLVLELCRRENLPLPEVNRNQEGHLVDFRWTDRRLVVEADGYEFHRGHGSFERDAERDNDLRATGWTVLRFTYRMLKYRPEYVKETILKALEDR